MKPGFTNVTCTNVIYNQWKIPCLLTFKYAAASWTVRFLWIELPHSCSPGKIKLLFISIYLLLHFIKSPKHKLTVNTIYKSSGSSIILTSSTKYMEKISGQISPSKKFKKLMIVIANMYKSHTFWAVHEVVLIFQYLLWK